MENYKIEGNNLIFISDKKTIKRNYNAVVISHSVNDENIKLIMKKYGKILFNLQRNILWEVDEKYIECIKKDLRGGD